MDSKSIEQVNNRFSNMDNTIIEILNCHNEPMFQNVANYIIDMREQINRLTAELEQVRRERDTINRFTVPRSCSICANFDIGGASAPWKKVCKAGGCTDKRLREKWQWRDA